MAVRFAEIHKRNDVAFVVEHGAAAVPERDAHVALDHRTKFMVTKAADNAGGDRSFLFLSQGRADDIDGRSRRWWLRAEWQANERLGIGLNERYVAAGIAGQHPAVDLATTEES